MQRLNLLRAANPKAHRCAYTRFRVSSHRRCVDHKKPYTAVVVFAHVFLPGPRAKRRPKCKAVLIYSLALHPRRPCSTVRNSRAIDLAWFLGGGYSTNPDVNRRATESAVDRPAANTLPIMAEKISGRRAAPRAAVARSAADACPALTAAPSDRAPSATCRGHPTHARGVAERCKPCARPRACMQACVVRGARGRGRRSPRASGRRRARARV